MMVSRLVLLLGFVGVLHACHDGASIIDVDRADDSPATAPPPVEPTSPAELPRIRVDTEWFQPAGNIIRVQAGGDIQAAIDAAVPGDVVLLEPGEYRVRELVLPPRDGNGWITIMSSGVLPAPGERIDPGMQMELARIVGTDATERVLRAAAGAQRYRLAGLHFSYDEWISRVNAIVHFESGSRHIILDRSMIRGHDQLDVQRCLILHSEHGAVVDSHLSGCHYKGADSQAIVAWNTNGPLKIVNNYLEGAGENVMLGGATPDANTLVSDVEIRQNYFHKPAQWRLEDGSSRWTVKNLFEIKFAVRVLLEENVFDGNWRDGQDGHAMNIKLSARGSGDRVSDITIRYNVLRNSEHGVKISAPTERLHMHDNVVHDVDGRLFTLLGGSHIWIENNTAVHGGSIIAAAADHSGFVARNNIWDRRGGYGVKGSTVEGTATLESDFDGYVYEGNVHIGGDADRYPSGNAFAESLEQLKFRNAAAHDFRLTEGSPFRTAGVSGSVPGANMVLIERALLRAGQVKR